MVRKGSPQKPLVPPLLTHSNMHNDLQATPLCTSPKLRLQQTMQLLDQQHSFLLKAGLGPHLYLEHTAETEKGQRLINIQAVDQPIEQPNTQLKRLPAEEKPNTPMHAPHTHTEGQYYNKGSEKYKQSCIPCDHPSLSNSPSDHARNTDVQRMSAGCRHEKASGTPAEHDPFSSSATASGNGGEMMMTAFSCTELCLMGWQRFCDLLTPAGKAPFPKVSEVHRPIVMTSNPDRQVISTSAHTASLSDHEVCLELNIGPSRGGPPAANSRKPLQDIHSEERSGFSKWQRPVPKEKDMVQMAQHPCKPGRSLWPEKLDRATPLKFSLGLNNDTTIASYPSTLFNSKNPVASMSYKCKNMDKSAISSGSIASVGSPFNATCPSTPPNLGMWMTDSHLHQCSEEAGVHAHDHKLLPTNILLRAAFPSDIPVKRRKVNNSYDAARPIENEVLKDKQEKKISQQFIGKLDADHIRYQLTLSIPCNTIRCVDMPNVQERSLVDFLHAKKQHKEHFLDKVVVQEDVYKSHPWHFSSVKRDSVTKGGGSASLYFCCSTKYTKRGNMTRNRMTREGGRWKQQGMVQPIFYGRGDVEAAHKTYLSYIPRGSAATATATTTDAARSAGSLCSRASFFVNYVAPNDDDNEGKMDGGSTSEKSAAHNPNMNSTGRLKHRHRMIEIALQEDLLLEKRSFQLKVAPEPFLVVCILRNTTT